MIHWKKYIYAFVLVGMYTAQDSAGNEANVTRTITIIDVTPPVITLNGESNITLEQNAPYTELGAMAVDAVDGNISVIISGNVDTSTVGSYTMTYSARDNAGNEANLTRSVTVINSVPVLSCITLESNATTVNVGDTVKLSVMGTYSDGSSNAVDENITYTIIPNDSAEVNGSMFTAKKDGNVTVQATVGGVGSNTLNLSITWVVNGHVLPPEPDPAKNDATLLGVDSNNDGVRDDIERKVYATYPKAIQRAVMMQAFRAEQKMLADPDMVNNARVWEKKITQYIDCTRYLYMHESQARISRKEASLMLEWQFNNKERVKLYMNYNKALSGGVYSINRPKQDDCQFNVEEVLEMDK